MTIELSPAPVEADAEPGENIVHYACPMALGDRIVTAYCGFTQEFPYDVWNNSPPEVACAMCVEEHRLNPVICPKFGTCQGGECVANR